MLKFIIYNRNVCLFQMRLRPLNVLNLIPFVRLKRRSVKMQLYTPVLIIPVHKKRKKYYMHWV